MHNEIRLSLSHERVGPGKRDYKYLVKAEVIDNWGEHWSAVDTTIQGAVTGLLGMLNANYEEFRKVQ